MKQQLKQFLKEIQRLPHDVKEMFFPSRDSVWVVYEGETYHVVAEYKQAGTTLRTSDDLYTTTTPPHDENFYFNLKEKLKEKYDIAPHIVVQITTLRKIS